MIYFKYTGFYSNNRLTGIEEACLTEAAYKLLLNLRTLNITKSNI